MRATEITETLLPDAELAGYRDAGARRPDDPRGPVAPTTPSRFHIAVVCGLILLPILVWLWLFPYSGDGDSALHYLCVRTVWAEPISILGSWSRPLHKVLILLPSIAGNTPTRLVQAAVMIALAWQTILLAGQLGVRNAILAGPLILVQPYVFALASDTMTEIPMALAIVIAVRLWMSGRIAWSCVAASFLPLLRPEGFFLIAMWGLLLLLPRVPSDAIDGGKSESRSAWPGLAVMFRRRFIPACLLSVGMIAWTIACWIFAHDPLYFIRLWSWPMESYADYPPGAIYHYVAWWPVYTGLVLLGPFLIGVWPIVRRPRFVLVWAIWLLVFVLHTMLFWLHKFASVGLVRILACTSPMTALVCLEGFNVIGGWLARRGVRAVSRRRLAISTLVGSLFWAMGQYLVIGEHYHCFGYRALVREADARHLLGDFHQRESSDDPAAPRLFAGDKIFLAMLGLHNRWPHFMDSSMDGAEQRILLAKQPIGTVGAWDNEQSVWWHSVTIDELPALGYTIVYEYDQTVPDLRECVKRRAVVSHQRYVLVRKDR